MTIPSNFQSWWQNTKQNSIGWSTLRLFAIGLIVLLTLMSNLPYVASKAGS